ncbi:hypothetical protein BDA99DRAFT_607450 [Phascolomyces articulosus]|uniref:F-box domain-containing protein n=1 Tax=Phascolomyces articulosus TaxID=60185 RepID=A0AAD5K403_9FUNG|nr:hypothetical protein BDA99DRAFT_607450 [Phascolomyces articulosus]
MLLDTPISRTTATPVNISRLTLDILQLILDHLDTYSLSQLSQTCRVFHSLVRKELSFEYARYYPRTLLPLPSLQQMTRRRRDSTVSTIFPMSPDDHDGAEVPHTTVDCNNKACALSDESATLTSNGILVTDPEPNTTTENNTTPSTGGTSTATATTTIPLHIPPVFHQQCMARIGNKLYMPLMLMEPICFVYDIQHGFWQKHLLEAYTGYTPFVTPVVSIGSRIFMFGGRQVIKETLSNNMVVLNIETWVLERIKHIRGSIPSPRYDHTVNVLHQRYLIVFGGACSNSPGENDLHLFDTEINTWTEPKTNGQIPPTRFGHASAILGHHLYIFGGCQIQPEWNMVHDVLYQLDTENWIWYKYDHPEAYSYRHSSGSEEEGEENIDEDRNDINIENSGATNDGMTMMMQPTNPTTPPPAMTTIVDSLRRDLILETTGHPPCDRFYCSMQAIGSHKLIIFGGQTVRQDRDDNNILHAHSLRSIDVFNIRRNHWSAIPTTSLDGESHAHYPQNISCFLINNHEYPHRYQQQQRKDNNHHHGYYTLLLIGQQKVFSLSSGDSSSISGASSGGDFNTYSNTTTDHAPPLLGLDNHMYASTPQLPTIRQPPSLIHTHSSPPDPILRRGMSLSSSPSSFSPVPTTSQQPSYIHHNTQQQQQHFTFTPSSANNITTPLHYHHHPHPMELQQQQRTSRCVLSRPMADYEGLLDMSGAFDEYSTSQQHATTTTTSTEINGLLQHPTNSDDHIIIECHSNTSNNNSLSGGGGSCHSHHHTSRQQYNLEPLCIILALDHD